LPGDNGNENPFRRFADEPILYCYFDLKRLYALRQTLRAQRSAPQAGVFYKIGISRFYKK
jgi:hypothetical protein